MNPLTNVKNLQKINQRELELGVIGKKSWHDQYKDSAWVFIGGLPYDLTEGDVVCVFSQYGEIVNLNLVRDKQTGKTKGFGFLCYEDQRSTVLAVDNLNGFKLCGRILRVDHVSEYKLPKELQDADEVTKKIREKGIAPRTPSPEAVEEEEEIEESYEIPIKKIKKEKKNKKEKKRKRKKHATSESSDDSEDIKSKVKVEKIKVKQEKEDDGFKLSVSKNYSDNGYQKRKEDQTDNMRENNGRIKSESISCECSEYRDERRSGDRRERFSEKDRQRREEADQSEKYDRFSDKHILDDRRQKSERTNDFEISRSGEKRRHQNLDRHGEYGNERYSKESSYRRHERRDNNDTDSYGRNRYNHGREDRYPDRHHDYRDRYHR